MAEKLTMAEIAARYPSEWVLIDQPETDQYHHVLGGTVVFHGPDREEVYRQACVLPIPRWFAVRYTGELFPPDMEFLLSMTGTV